MNKYALTALAVVIALVVAFVPVEMQAQDRTLAGEYNLDYEAIPNAGNMAYTAVATGTITALSDRVELRVYCLEPLVASTAWIAINSATATTSQGIPVFRGSPLIINLSDDVSVSWSASEALKLLTVQTSR